jgi:hypothetical protein
LPASTNYWNERKTDEEIDGYVELFDKLGEYVCANKDPRPDMDECENAV